MKDITLEKVDQIRERTGVSYEIAKEALTINKGDLLEALIYIENNVVVPFAEKEKVKDENPVITGEEVKGETVDEFKAWLKKYHRKRKCKQN